MFDSVAPWAVVCQAPISMEFSREEYWNGLPFPPPEDLPHPGIESRFPALAGGFFIIWAIGKSNTQGYNFLVRTPICLWNCVVLDLSVPLDGEGNGTPLQYSCLENPMDRGAWWAAVHGVDRSRTRLSDFTFTLHFHALEKEMATHSSVLAWRIPGTGEPGGLSSLGSHRVGHDWSDLAVPLELVTTLQGSGQAQIWWCIWKGFVKCKLIHKCKVVWLYLCLFFVNGFFILKCNWLTILLVSGVQWWFSIFTHWKMITMISLTTTCHHTVIIV